MRPSATARFTAMTFKSQIMNAAILSIALTGTQVLGASLAFAQVSQTAPAAKPAAPAPAAPAPAPAAPAPAPAPAAPAPAPAPAAPAPAAPAPAAPAPAPAAPAPAPAPAAPAPAAAPATETPAAVPLADEPAAAAAPPAATEPTPPAAAAQDDAGYSDATAVEPVTEEAAHKKSPFMLGVLWDLSIPVGSTTDFTSKVSPRGVSVDGRYRGFGNLGFGFTVAWHTLSEKTRRTTTYGPATISGVQVRETSSTPFTAKVFYALRDMKKVIPYAGFGLGGARVLRRLDIGISRFTDESWHFAIVPELGIEVPTGSFDLLASTRFNYLFKSSDGPEQLYFNLSVGVGFH